MGHSGFLVSDVHKSHAILGFSQYFGLGGGPWFRTLFLVGWGFKKY